MNSPVPEDLSKKDDDEVLRSMQGAFIGSDHYQHCRIVLELRNMKRMVTASNGLVKATRLLIIAAFVQAAILLFQLFQLADLRLLEWIKGVL